MLVIVCVILFSWTKWIILTSQWVRYVSIIHWCRHEFLCCNRTCSRNGINTRLHAQQFFSKPYVMSIEKAQFGNGSIHVIEGCSNSSVEVGQTDNPLWRAVSLVVNQTTAREKSTCPFCGSDSMLNSFGPWQRGPHSALGGHSICPDPTFWRKSAASGTEEQGKGWKFAGLIYFFCSEVSHMS